ncbi:MAG: tyrosine-type recombinase/integrase [Solirubrobacteraceae bacterium]
MADLLRAACSHGASEIVALRWADVQLDGDRPHVKVRRACVWGVMGPPKSKYGRREVPIGHDLVTALRAAHKATEWHEDTDPVFPGHTGGVLGYDNTLRRALRPTAEEAGVPWVGFHSFRHTAATRLFAAGRNAVQVQRWLGHHSPAFTLSLYVHLLDGDLGEPVDLPRQRDFSRCQCDIRTCRGVVEDGMVAEHRKADL